MTQKHITSIAVALALGGIALYMNRDWFKRDPIQIYHNLKSARSFANRNRREGPDVLPVFFGFSRPLKLTSVEVVAVDELQTNRIPQPVWHLVSDSNSPPTKGFIYGGTVPGMRPSLKGAAAEPLAAGLHYRLLIEWRSGKAHHDFSFE